MREYGSYEGLVESGKQQNYKDMEEGSSPKQNPSGLPSGTIKVGSSSSWRLGDGPWFPGAGWNKPAQQQ